MKRVNKSILLRGLAALCLILGWLVAFYAPVLAAASEQIAYVSGADGNATVYGVNWEGQTFTTPAGDTFSVANIRIMVWRVNTPGTITVSIRATSAGNIAGNDIVSGTYNGDTVTTSSSGEWITVDMSSIVILAPSTVYGIVVRATSGNSTDYINWRMDTTSPAYTGGSRTSSSNSGSSWSLDTTDDMMFAVWGESTFEIISAAVFPSVFEDNDRYIAIHYNVAVPPMYPGNASAPYFSVILFDGATDYAKIPLCDWGSRVTAIYLSASSARNFSWGLSSVGVTIEPTGGGGSPSDTYYMQPDDWKTNNPWEIDNWVREAAQDIEDYYGVDIVTRNYPTADGNVTMPEGEGILTITGSVMFKECMHSLDEIRPELFMWLQYSPDMPDTAFTRTYEEGIDWEARLGPTIVADITTVSDEFNLDPKVALGLGMFGGYIVVVGAATWKWRDPSVPTGGAVPLIAAYAWVGLFPLAVAAIIGLFMTVLTVWIVWLRST